MFSNSLLLWIILSFCRTNEVSTYLHTARCTSTQSLTRLSASPLFLSGRKKNILRSRCSSCKVSSTTSLHMWSKLIPAFNCEQFPNAARLFFPSETDYSTFCLNYKDFPTLQASDILDISAEVQNVLFLGIIMYSISRLAKTSFAESSSSSSTSSSAYMELQEELDKEAFVEAMNERDADIDIRNSRNKKNRRDINNNNQKSNYYRASSSASENNVIDSNSIYYTCPQCNGRGVFLRQSCELCGGAGQVLNNNAYGDFLPTSTQVSRNDDRRYRRNRSNSEEVDDWVYFDEDSDEDQLLDDNEHYNEEIDDTRDNDVTIDKTADNRTNSGIKKRKQRDDNDDM